VEREREAVLSVYFLLCFILSSSVENEHMSKYGFEDEKA
jgi:hypothetical protein